ncbi:hypothetical protein BG003_010953 [Podila horticola]|nr:hypothetical protein BG003_010953 [Podila horticola]
MDSTSVDHHLNANSTTAEASHSSINIPEISALISVYLSKKDLNSCCQVSQSWRQQFAPLLWRAIKVLSPGLALIHGTVPADKTETDTAIVRKHGRHIRELVVHTHTPEASGANPPYETALPLHNELPVVLDCFSITNLTRLHLAVFSDNRAASQGLIERNKDTLRFLFVGFQFDSDNKPTREQKRTWRRQGNKQDFRIHLFQLPTLVNLQSLYLEKCYLTKDRFLDILKGCPVLKELSLRKVQLRDPRKAVVEENITEAPMDGLDLLESLIAEREQDPHHQIVDTPLPTPDYQHHGIQTFRMCGELYLVLEHFPNLKTLEFYRFDRPSDTLQLNDFCASIHNFCPHLQEIWAYGFECSMLPRIVDSTRRLVRFRGCSDLETVLSILGHSDTLEEANLSDYSERTFLPLRFLESCPRLQAYRSSHTSTTTQEVLASITERGWACKDRLKELRLSIKGLSPAPINEIMVALRARRVLENSHRVRLAAASGQAAISNEGLFRSGDVGSMPFHEALARFLGSLPRLERLNLGTGCVWELYRSRLKTLFKIDSKLELLDFTITERTTCNSFSIEALNANCLMLEEIGRFTA